MVKIFKKTDSPNLPSTSRRQINILTVLVLIGLIACFYIFNSSRVKASPGTVEFTTDVELNLTGLDTTTYIASGSKSDSLTISGTDLNVSQVWASIAFLLKTKAPDPEHKVLQLTPSGGTADFTFSSSYISSGYISQWSETSSVSVAHIVGVPNANTDYTVRVDGTPISGSPFDSGASAEVSFSYTGGGTFTIGNEAPVISSITADDPVYSLQTQTITPSGVSDSESDDLRIYCCRDTINSYVPDDGDTCDNDQAWSSPYSSMTCTYNVPDVLENTLYYARCRVYDGASYSETIVSDSYTILAGGTAAYGIELDSSTKEFEGWTWGGNTSYAISRGTIGWLSWNCNNQSWCATSSYYVYTTAAFTPAGPTTSDTFETQLTCSNTSTPAYTDAKHPILSWTCSDTQTQRQIEIATTTTDCSSWPGSSTWTWNSEVDSDSASSSNSIDSQLLTDEAGVDFTWGETYCWRAKTKAEGTEWGEWAENAGTDKKSTDLTNGFTLPIHNYPLTYFVCSYTKDTWYDCDDSGNAALSLIPDEFRSVMATTTKNEIEVVAGLPTAPAPNQRVYMKDVSTCYNVDDSDYACVNATGTDTFYNWNLETIEGLVGNYGFDEGIRYPNTTGITDYTAYNNDGTLYLESSGTTDLATARQVLGQFGYALMFDGYDDRVEIPASDYFNSTTTGGDEQSIEFWFQPEGYPSGDIARLMSRGGGSYEIGLASGDGTAGAWDTDVGKLLIRTDIMPWKAIGDIYLATSTWHHVVSVYKWVEQAGAYRWIVYYDGEQKGYEPCEYINTYGKLFFGSNYEGYHPYYGLMDSIRIYNRVLTDAEVAHHYAAGPNVRAEENPSYSFMEGTWEISLNTCDTHSPDEECEHCEGGGTGLPLPEWKEIAPY